MFSLQSRKKVDVDFVTIQRLILKCTLNYFAIFTTALTPLDKCTIHFYDSYSFLVLAAVTDFEPSILG